MFWRAATTLGWDLEPRDARRRFLEWVPLTLKMLAGLFSLAGTSPPARNRPVKLAAGRF